MRKPVCACLSVLVLSTICLASQRAEEGGSAGPFFGTWSGTWESTANGSGGFELTLESGKDNVATGRVSVTGEPTYKTTLRTVSFEGTKMTATYDFPPDEQIEIVLAATFDDQAAKGTWLARMKGGGAEVASGTWSVTRK